MTNTQSATETKVSVVKSALFTAMGTFLSRVLGLVRDLVITAYFDRTVTDVFYVAFRLPNMFRRLLGEGALAVSFMPIYLDLKKNSTKKDEHRRLAAMLWTSLIIITGLICAFVVTFMETLLPYMVGGDGYASIQGKVELTVTLSKIMFFYLLFVTAYAFLSALAQAHMKFFIPAFAAAVFNATVVVAVLLGRTTNPIDPTVLGWGVLVGGVFQMLMVVVQLVMIGEWPKFELPRRGFKALHKVLINMGPSVLGLGVLQIMGFANVYFASRLQEGTHSYIFLADRLLEFPQALIAISIGTALLPVLSQHFSSNNRHAARTELTRQLNLMFLMSIPSAIGLYFLASPIVGALYQRGAFTANDAAVTAMITQFYALLLLTSGVNKILVTGFYASKNTWTPALLSGISVVFHVAFANYATIHFGLKGLILSTVLSSIINMVGTIILSEVMILRLEWLRIINFFLRSAPANIAVYFVCTIGFKNLVEVVGLHSDIALACTVVASMAVYFTLCWLLKVEEFSLLEAKLRKRFKNKK
jgi:putative peptidoglycan lipid II flippase